jgi:hypothetical protein
MCLYPRDFRSQFGREMLQAFRLRMILKCVGWASGGLVATFLVAWIICFVYVWHTEPSVVVFQAFKNHEGEIRSGSAGVEWWGHFLGYLGGPLFHLWGLEDLQATGLALKELESSDFCSFDPDQAYRKFKSSISDVGEGKNYVPNGYKAWKSATLTMAELEMGQEVLKLKSVMQSKKGEEDLRQLTTADSGLCPHIKWDHVLEPDGSVTIKANRLPVWLAVEEKHELPLSYTVRR